MVKRITISIPGYNPSNSSHKSAHREAIRILDQIAAGNVSSGETSVHTTDYTGHGSNGETRAKTLVAVTSDDGLESGVIDDVHSFLVSSIKTPEGTSIETRVEDVGEYYVG